MSNKKQTIRERINFLRESPLKDIKLLSNVHTLKLTKLNFDDEVSKETEMKLLINELINRCTELNKENEVLTTKLSNI